VVKVIERCSGDAKAEAAQHQHPHNAIELTHVIFAHDSVHVWLPKTNHLPNTRPMSALFHLDESADVATQYCSRCAAIAALIKLSRGFTEILGSHSDFARIRVNFYHAHVMG
jgi:hypothetical protein